MNTFRIDVPLPTGPLFVEASAGTGKTWSIARLVARLLAEDPPEGGPPPRIEQMLVVTFTNAATAELRDRVRLFLAAAVAELERVRQAVEAGQAAAPDDDPALALLAGVQSGKHWHAHPAALLQTRSDRLKRALRDFDKAAISTIHGFCQKALVRLAFESGTDFDSAILKQTRDLMAEVVDDWLAKETVHVDDARYVGLTTDVGLTRARLLDVAKHRLGVRRAHFLPDTPPNLDHRRWREVIGQQDGGLDEADKALWHAAVFADFADFAQVEFDKRLRRRRQISFDSLLEQVADGLGNPAFIDDLRTTYRVALIDEFQDTDGLQWQIFREVFLASPTARLILIGDPKQAIYGFRSADLKVYTAARAAIADDRCFTMRRNFRSDAQLVEALNCALVPQPALLGFDDIPIEPVAAHFPDRLATADGERPAPLVVRWFDGTTFDAEANVRMSNSVVDKSLPRLLARDLAAELKAGWMRLVDNTERPVQAGDFAVLTVTNKESYAIRDALLAAGVPAVIARSGSVFDTDEASWLTMWLAVLAAGDDGALRKLASCPLYGWTARQLLDARQGSDVQTSRHWLRLREQRTAQAKRLRDDGVVAAFATMLYEPSPPDARTPLQRLAARTTGEAHLTNLRHLAELLDEAARNQRLDADGLGRWLAERADSFEENEAAQLRLESDEAAVKIATIHASKGLEYPIVYVTSLSDGRVIRFPAGPIRFHAPGDDHWTVDLRGLKPAELAHAQQASRELQEERLRLMYVALTRGVHRVVVYGTAPTGKSHRSPLPEQDYRLSPLAAWMHGRADPATSAQGNRVDQGMAAAALLMTAADPTQLTAAVEEACRAMGAPIFEPAKPIARATAGLLPGGQMPAQAPAVFGRTELDNVWRRESYTGLVRHRTGRLAVELEPDDGGVRQDDDELPSAPGDDAIDDGIDRGAAPATLDIADPEDEVPAETADVPLRAFYGGAEAGTWVHGVLETLSFGDATPKDGRPLSELVRAHGQRNGFNDPARDALLCEALPQILATPLGPATGDLRLAAVADGDRLDELKFDLPIGRGAGERVTAESLMQAVGAARTDDPMPAGYLAHVRQLEARTLSGFLTGAIDLVFRAEVTGRQQWFVVDYKTNQLGPRQDGRIVRSAAGHYAKPWLQREMARKHYYVQYMLYLTALHRYLQARLPGYDYDRDIGGALYLFVRGMQGAATPRDADGQPAGVFFDKPPRGHIEQLSRLLTAEAPCS